MHLGHTSQSRMYLGDFSRFATRRKDRIMQTLSDIETKQKNNLQKTILILLVLLVVISIAVWRNRTDERNYLNAEATWHVLLTIEAYRETSASVHKFYRL